MTTVAWATWALVLVTGGLFWATFSLVRITKGAYEASQQQSKVMIAQVKALRDLREALGTLGGSMSKMEEVLGTRKTGVFPRP